MGVLLPCPSSRPQNLCWSLAHIQQRPGGGQLYWLTFLPRPHQAPGELARLPPSSGWSEGLSLWSWGRLGGQGLQGRASGLPGSSGTVVVWTWGHSLGNLWACSAPSGCCLCGQLTGGCPGLEKAGPSAPAEKGNGGRRSNGRGRCSEPRPSLCSPSGCPGLSSDAPGPSWTGGRPVRGLDPGQVGL